MSSIADYFGGDMGLCDAVSEVACGRESGIVYIGLRHEELLGVIESIVSPAIPVHVYAVPGSKARRNAFNRRYRITPGEVSVIDGINIDNFTLTYPDALKSTLMVIDVGNITVAINRYLDMFKGKDMLVYTLNVDSVYEWGMLNGDGIRLVFPNIFYIKGYINDSTDGIEGVQLSGDSNNVQCQGTTGDAGDKGPATDALEADAVGDEPPVYRGRSAGNKGKNRINGGAGRKSNPRGDGAGGKNNSNQDTGEQNRVSDGDEGNTPGHETPEDGTTEGTIQHKGLS